MKNQGVYSISACFKQQEQKLDRIYKDKWTTKIVFAGMVNGENMRGMTYNRGVELVNGSSL